MKNNNDIEKDLKHRLSELGDAENAASAGEVKRLLDRLEDYRGRLRDQRHKWDLEIAPLRRELSEHRWMVGWARKQLAPKGGPTGVSSLDCYEMVELLREVDKRVGHRIAHRLLHATDIDPDLAQERLGALEAAITEAKAAEERWRKHLRNSRNR